MTDQQDDPTRNIGEDPLTASPGSGRGGKEGDQIPEQIEDAERTKGTEYPVEDSESQEERGAAVTDSPGHVADPGDMSDESSAGHP